MRVSALTVVSLLAGVHALPRGLSQPHDASHLMTRDSNGGILARQDQANSENQEAQQTEENPTFTQEEYDARIAENKAKQKIIDLGTTGRQAVFQKLGCRYETTESELALEGITKFLENEIEACLPRFLNLKPEEQDDIIQEVKDEWAEEEKRKKEEEEKRKKEEEEKKKAEEEGKKELEKMREEEDNLWVSEDANTNTKIAIGDDQISFGTELDPVDAIKEIKKQCGEQGCQPGKIIRMKTMQIIENRGVERNIEMTVNGPWASKGELGNLDQLLEALEVVIKELKDNGHLKSEKQTFHKGTCRPVHFQGYVCDDKTVYEEDQWYVPSHFQVSVRVPVPPKDENSQAATALVADLNIGFAVEQVDEFGGWCGSVAGGVAGIAGAIANPAGPIVAGGILVGAIFCNAIP